MISIFIVSSGALFLVLIYPSNGAKLARMDLSMKTKADLETREGIIFHIFKADVAYVL